MAIVFVIFSYVGTEIVAVTAGEAKNPEIALPRAVRTMVARLILFYLGAVSCSSQLCRGHRFNPAPT